MKPPKGIPTIDRTKYASILNQPMTGTGTNIVGSDTTAFNPAILKANGYNLVSGSGKDAVWEKNGNYHIYNEQPNAAQNKFGFVNIGKPGSAPAATPLPLKTSAQKTAVAPGRLPINFSNPNITTDPNTGNSYNPVTGQQIKPIVEQYKKGGPVKVPGYDAGGAVERDPFNNSYNNQFANANQKNQNASIAKSDEEKAAQQAKARGLANSAGTALGTYGAAYYAQNPGENSAEQTRSAALGAVGAAGPVGGAVSGIAGIGDKIGAPLKAKYERTDAQGNLLNDNQAQRNAIIGGFLSPSKILAARSQYKGGWTDISGNGYTRHIEDVAKQKIQSDVDAQNAVINQTNAANNAIGLDATLAARDANQTDNTNNFVAQTANIAQPDLAYKPHKVGAIKGAWRKVFKEGGEVTGPGTGTSDSINAKVKPGSFIVPATNAAIAASLRENVLNKPVKAAKLKQKGGVNIKISNGEHLFTPQEKDQILSKGININALAPGALSTTTAMKGGGEVAAKRAEHQRLAQRIASKQATPQERVQYDRLSKEFGPIKTAPVLKSGFRSSAPPAKTNPIFSQDWASKNPGPESAPNAPANLAQTATVAGGKPSKEADAINQESYDKDWAALNAPASSSSGKNGFNAGKLIDYGIPLVQGALGFKYLKDAGKRPVDQLDPDYLQSIDTAKGNVVTANANAKFGFSPEEQSQIDQQNNQLTNTGRYDARNFSGGSSSNALNMERSVINDSFARGLSAKVQNRNLIFDKQNIANQRQQYADSLIAGKVGMSNRLFNMKLDAWQQQQSTGQGLIAAGLQNAIGAKQWQDELQMSKDRNSMYNPNPVTTV